MEKMPEKEDHYFPGKFYKSEYFIQTIWNQYHLS